MSSVKHILLYFDIFYMLSVKHILLYFHIFTCFQSNIYCYTFTFLHVISQTSIVILSHFYTSSVKQYYYTTTCYLT